MSRPLIRVAYANGGVSTTIGPKAFSEMWWILQAARLVSFMVPLPFTAGDYTYTRENGILTVTQRGGAR